ncbi:MAG TPA: hypothetical protein VK737_09830 [Opitutales bacterium]|jgi:hypothetical protein|nr:hypothetical protein [Opitutales bacterium]
MKLTNKSVLQLRAALLSLDGLDKSVEVKGQTQLIKKPFKLDGKTRLKIARNLRATETAFEDYDSARVGLVREFSADGQQVAPDKLPEFTQRLEDLLADEADLALAPLAEDDLNLDDNEIPHAALASILQHLVDINDV